MAGGGGEGGESDLAATAWPGFVDILSSVLIMFVFFLMITAVAFNFHVILFKAKLKSNNDKVIQEEVDTEVATLGGELKTENDRLKRELAQIQQQKIEDEQVHVEAQRELETKLQMMQQSAQMAASEDQTIQETSATSRTIFYGADAISLTEDSTKALSDFIAANPGATVVIEANLNTTNKYDQTARRVAVARMLNARNVPLKAGVGAGSIKASLTNGEPIDGRLDWVRLSLQK